MEPESALPYSQAPATNKNIHTNKYDDRINLLTAVGLTPGGSSTVHRYTQISTQNNTMKTQ